jgi:hypothetical protein
MCRITFVLLGIIIFTTITTTHIAAEPQEEGTISTSKAHTKSYSQPKATGGTVMSKDKELVIFDFTKASDLNQWRSINDTVMGGISESQLQLTKEGNVLFTGNVSLENNGGFASLQSKPSEYNFAGYEGIAIRLKGDGKRYKFSLKTNEYLDSTRYEAAFNTDKGAWTIVRIPFRTLVPTFRGKILTNEPPLDISKVKSFGLLISDKQKGPFRLEIAWIKAY